jgi:signal transduction histidine kinase
MVDRQQIKQILLNLFLNALEALQQQGGQLIVKTHRLNKSTGDPWVQMEVTDTGPGISAADLEHIFDPFFTTKHASTEREGTGLGLTIVHQIVQEHSGYIEVISEMGKGTTFLVNLPVKPHEFVEKKRSPIN